MFVYLIGSTASVINYQLVGNRWRVRLCNKWPCIVTRVWSPLHTLAQIPHKSITSHICLLQNTLKKNAYWHRLSTNHSHLYRSHKMFSDQGQIRIERLFLSMKCRANLVWWSIDRIVLLEIMNHSQTRCHEFGIPQWKYDCYQYITLAMDSLHVFIFFDKFVCWTNLDYASTNLVDWLNLISTPDSASPNLWFKWYI